MYLFLSLRPGIKTGKKLQSSLNSAKIYHQNTYLKKTIVGETKKFYGERKGCSMFWFFKNNWLLTTSIKAKKITEEKTSNTFIWQWELQPHGNNILSSNGDFFIIVRYVILIVGVLFVLTFLPVRVLEKLEPVKVRKSSPPLSTLSRVGDNWSDDPDPPRFVQRSSRRRT